MKGDKCLWQKGVNFEEMLLLALKFMTHKWSAATSVIACRIAKVPAYLEDAGRRETW